MKIRSTLEKLRKKRHLLRVQRKHKEFPVVSVLGYTNCGGRSQPSAATNDYSLQPQGIQSCSQTPVNLTVLMSSPRKNHPDQGADRRRRPSAQKPAVCHSGCHRSRRPVAQSHDSPVRRHHRLPVSTAAPAHRLLLRHLGGHQALGERSRKRSVQILIFTVLFQT